ncbi:acyl-CoA dehydrogenase family protein [Micromonospora sp. R77]|uniref:acyl-CoA dehydrogenase family protein n=1 Tax=Micromonospora sp. R77 TaxID=2925836 RepID=UPI001F621FE4|nr:acyl-CoA dehydrogenase family protein [Micromonospora sp. R77]MCI4062050.1 acyl-CoA dehydrogenase family protein [Micromonospora sp. R77]
MSSSSLVESVAALARQVRTDAAAIEQAGRLPEPLLGRLAELGVFRLAAPRSAGGLEADPLTLCTIVHDLARADGSVGWCAMIAAATSVTLGHLDEQVAADLLADPGFLIAGVAAPLGRARPVDDGYRLTGRWAFASASRHATWLVLGAVLAGESGPGGRPVLRHLVVPAAEVLSHDTWQVAGLRATGSDDVEARDVLVPANRSFSLFGPVPPRPGALYAFPVFSYLSLGVGAAALGIARAAVDEIGRLAREKPIPGQGGTIAGRPAVRTAVARAEMLLGGGWHLLRATVAECWQTALAGDPVTLEQRARLRLAAANAAGSAAAAVDLAYQAGGGTSVYASSPLQRHFRDVHVATQHAMVGPDIVELAGAVLLGQQVDTARL